MRIHHPRILSYVLLTGNLVFHKRIKKGSELTDYYTCRIQYKTKTITFQYWKNPSNDQDLIFTKGLITEPNEFGITQSEIHGFRQLEDIVTSIISA